MGGGAHLQTREQLDELGEEREEDKPDEAGLAGGLGDFVSVHEGSHWETFDFLCVALQDHKAQKMKLFGKYFIPFGGKSINFQPRVAARSKNQLKPAKNQLQDQNSWWYCGF